MFNDLEKQQKKLKEEPIEKTGKEPTERTGWQAGAKALNTWTGIIKAAYVALIFFILAIKAIAKKEMYGYWLFNVALNLLGAVGWKLLAGLETGHLVTTNIDNLINGKGNACKNAVSGLPNNIAGIAAVTGAGVNDVNGELAKQHVSTYLFLFLFALSFGAKLMSGIGAKDFKDSAYSFLHAGFSLGGVLGTFGLLLGSIPGVGPYLALAGCAIASLCCAGSSLSELINWTVSESSEKKPVWQFFKKSAVEDLSKIVDCLENPCIKRSAKESELDEFSLNQQRYKTIN